MDTPSEQPRPSSSHDQPTIVQTQAGRAASEQVRAGEPPGPAPLSRLGEYEILREIGRGGMGVVYQARHVRLNRIVAVKVIRGGDLADSHDLQRFDTEAAAAAQLQHSGIVALYEVGTHDRQPFLAMEFIDGSNLAQRIVMGPLSSRRAAGYVEAMARAIHYAHGRGILHRDLKPANVLLDEHDQPKLTDFGLAKWLTDDGSGQTRTGAVLGTPSYMAPEQAAGRKDLGPPADVYSLGAILYELLTARPPFQGESTLATLDQVAKKDPLPPRLLNPAVDRELETICLKCLEKEPRRRYASADELADDLQRYLSGEPIAARRMGRVGRCIKWCRRNPTFASVLALSLLGILIFLGVLWRVAHNERALRQREEKLRQDAEEQRHLAENRQEVMRHLLYHATIRRAEHALEQADFDRVHRLLHDKLPRSDKRELRDWEWHFLKERSHGRYSIKAHAGRAHAVVHHPTRDLFATAGGEPGLPGEIKLWDGRTGLMLRPLGGHERSITSLVFHSRLNLLFSAGYDQVIKAWDVDTGKEVLALRGHKKAVFRIALSADGNWLASAGADGDVRLWRLADDIALSPQEVKTLQAGEAEIHALVFDPQGKWFASAGRDKEIKFWDLTTFEPQRTFTGHKGEITSLAVSSGGKILVSGGGVGPGQGELRVWEVESGKVKATRFGLSDKVLAVAFSREGLIAAAGSDGFVRLWNYNQSTEPIVFRGDPHMVYALEFNRNGDTLLAAGHNGRVSLWNRSGGIETHHLQTPGVMESVAFDPKGRFVAAGGEPGLSLWRLDAPEKALPLPGHKRDVYAVTFCAGGRYLASAGEDGVIVLHDTSKLSEPPRRLTGHAGTIWGLAAHPEQPLLASAGEDETIRIWNVESGEVLHTLVGHKNGVKCVAFHPEGKLLASGSFDQTIRIWTWSAAGMSEALKGHTGTVTAVAFCADGGQLASAGKDRTIRLWELGQAGKVTTLEGISAPVTSLAYHPGGRRRLASCGQDKTVRFWDLIPNQEILEFVDRQGSVHAVSMSADGRWLAAAGSQGIRLWDAGRK